MLQDALNAEQVQHKITREDLLKRLGQASTETNARTEELASECDEVNTLLTRLRPQENKLVTERQRPQCKAEIAGKTLSEQQVRMGRCRKSVW